ncbi:hypothetical protein S40285_08171 [Stachybotrys chlorohalonatus IBT 40285]|uniref:FMN hydroxy acid dehydrogenase domain-containing protein n=1 Tax=Stachybotrys chlorohalonatus (strain IBT 40285) TaxID=1283841 RepID=A0A084R1S6_STAC4|nr:hypothetical protein S40285_08171 [Stachybotrys chlorohalonata IBT 40285]
MRTQTLLALASGALAARPWLENPDTGIELAIGDLPIGELPNVTSIVGLPDFEWVAQRYLPPANFTYYINGAAGEYSYRNNKEVYHRYRLRPRMMVDITNVPNTLNTTILGHTFSAPFFISPCARAGRGHPDAEINFVRGAAAGNILYMPALLADRTIEEIGEARAEGQVLFQQLYLENNETQVVELFRRAEAAGAAAIVYTVDSAADGNRHRARRFGVGSADSSFTYITWDWYKRLTELTDLPIILKGIQTVEDVELAIRNKVPAIILSNHGGRQIDDSPSSLEVALEIYRKDRRLFDRIEILADGGVRYGTDAIKLLALGVKAVGLGRPFMFANIFGQEGVEHAIELMRFELEIDLGNLGVPALDRLDASYVEWTPNNWAM